MDEKSGKSIKNENGVDAAGGSSNVNNNNNNESTTRKRKATGGDSMEGDNDNEVLQQQSQVKEPSIDNNNNNNKTTTKSLNSKTTTTTSCPYLDTIQRSLLDFDLEPSCSVSLQAGPHVYGCLICGKFFRGRGPQTPAYIHSVEQCHFVFIHLHKGTIHCLPEDYIVNDPSLNDIRAALHPEFTIEQIENLDRSITTPPRDLFGRRYLPGFVGLNNLVKTDGINAVLQALAHVPPLRDFFLKQSHLNVDIKKKNKIKKMSRLVQCFGELLRKMWSNKRFKSHVDPHCLIQAIVDAAGSSQLFAVGKQIRAGEFMAWFLHQLHVGLGGGTSSSIIHQVFRGKVQVTTRQAKKKKIPEQEDEDDLDELDEINEEVDDIEMTSTDKTKLQQQGLIEMEETTIDTHFIQLTLDIPEKPLFRDDADADGGLVIPQEPLVSVLKKFDGVTFSDVLLNNKVHCRKRYRLLKLPPYLILHLARFKTNNNHYYSTEKNPTIVVFPVKNLDLSQYVYRDNDESNKKEVPTEGQVRNMSIKEIKALLAKHGHAHLADNIKEKSELLDVTLDFVTKSLPDLLADKYDLVANITHDSPVGGEGQQHDPLQEGSYKCHVQHLATNQWYVMQDLHVQEIMPQMIGLSESYVLIFQRKSAQKTTNIISKK